MAKGKTLASMVTIAVVLSLISQPAHANMGVPMLTLVWPVMAMALVPIIIVESIVLVTGFGMTAWHSAWVVSVANLVSTVIGIPVTWFLLVLVRIPVGSYGIETAKKRFLAVILESAWMSPYEDKAMNWMVPASCLVLLVPFFFASWFVEHQVVVWMLGDLSGLAVANGVLIGNAITYGVLAVIAFTAAVHEYSTSVPVIATFGTTAEQTVEGNEGPIWSCDAEAWLTANQRARQGIAGLNAAETRIAKKGRILIESRSSEATRHKEKRAA